MRRHFHLHPVPIRAAVATIPFASSVASLATLSSSARAIVRDLDATRRSMWRSWIGWQLHLQFKVCGSDSMLGSWMHRACRLDAPPRCQRYVHEDKRT